MTLQGQSQSEVNQIEQGIGASKKTKKKKKQIMYRVSQDCDGRENSHLTSWINITLAKKKTGQIRVRIKVKIEMFVISLVIIAIKRATMLEITLSQKTSYSLYDFHNNDYYFRG